jgi:hypothetical protein
MKNAVENLMEPIKRTRGMAGGVGGEVSAVLI